VERTTLIKGEQADIEGTFAWIERRLKCVEDKLWPPIADGSGTERYDNWTQHSDGLEYPGSYGVVGNAEPDLKVGDSIRVINDDASVDPEVHSAVSATPIEVTFMKHGSLNAVPRDRVVKVIPPKE
jgi:hypothetical protein